MSTDYIVAKFGGTSVADYDAMLNCFNIISKDDNLKVVVLSASAGVTNLLVELAEGCDKEKRKELIERIRLIQFNIVNRLNFPEEIATRIENALAHIESLAEAANLATNKALSDAIVAHGELMSTMLFEHLCKEQGLKVHLLDARDVVVTNANFSDAAVNLEATNANREKVEKLFADGAKVITQGFIAREPEGRTTTLGRGGSDYSAAIFAELINAKECHIWTDVSGIFTTDPRICKNAQRIHEISFREASEMAIFGAKVLHPATILPAVRANIPVYIGNSKDPSSGGTWIRSKVENPPAFRGVAFKRNQLIVTINSLKMLGTSGFLSEVFRIFSKHNLVIDCVTTSETAVALTLDHKQNKAISELITQEIHAELSEHGHVKVEEGYTLVAIIGNNLQNTTAVSQTIKEFDHFPIRMILQGASANNICVLVPATDTEAVIQHLHHQLFEA